VPAETFLSGGGATPVLSFPASSSSPDDAGTTGALDLDAAALDAALPPSLPPTAPPQGGCAGCTLGTPDATSGGAVVALIALAFARLRRRS
jgi:MYXO-CTERM domain-containing protein